MFDDYLRSIILYFISTLYVQKVNFSLKMDSNNEATRKFSYIQIVFEFFVQLVVTKLALIYKYLRNETLPQQIPMIHCQRVILLFGARLSSKFKIAVIKYT